MANSVYIAASEANAGKSLITLGILGELQKKHARVALYRPIVDNNEKNRSNLDVITSHYNMDVIYDNSFAYTKDEAISLLASDNMSELMENVVAGYMDLLEKYDFVVCEGSSYHGVNSNYELELNSLMAKNIGAPVLFIANGLGKEQTEIDRSVQLGLNYYKKAGCNICGAILNRANVNNVLEAEAPFVGIIAENSNVETVESIEVAHLGSSINISDLIDTIENASNSGMTYKMFEYSILKKAKANKKHIVLPEGEDDRVLEAADILLKRDIVNLTILGDIDQIRSRATSLGLNISNATLVNPESSAKLDEYGNTFYELRKNKGISPEEALNTMKDVSYYGTMMVKQKDVHGMVSGAAHSTGDTIKPGFQILKTRPGTPVVSSVFFMCLDGRVSLFGDCAVNPNPTSEQLAAIAVSSAETADAFDIPRKVAMHSYSTGISGKGPDVELVTEATRIAREMRPEIDFEGPIQYDSAVDANVAKKKMPESKVAGLARVHIFPDLNTGNNCYKAVQRESGAQAIGPMLQGLNGAVNDLSRGCSVLDIINTVLITAIQSSQFE